MSKRVLIIFVVFAAVFVLNTFWVGYHPTRPTTVGIGVVTVVLIGWLLFGARPSVKKSKVG